MASSCSSEVPHHNTTVRPSRLEATWDTANLGILEVMAPERTDLILASDIPHGEADVLVVDGFNIEPWSPPRGVNEGMNARDEMNLRRTYSLPQQASRSCHEPMVGIVVTISPSLSL